MNIWLINHYAVPLQYYPLARPAIFAKYLQRSGHRVTIFAASTVHNSDQNLITDGRNWREEYVDGVHYVYIRCRDYQGNGGSRILNMCEFAWKLPGVCARFDKPDAIVATSMPPMSCAVGIHLAQKYGCRAVAEIADLWPESLIAYDVAGPRNPAVLLLRRLEKWIYKKADAIVFTMEGAYDYILEQGWEKDIPRSKVHFINNGVDMELFEYNRQHYPIEDRDLDDSDAFKIVYTGSLRKANNLGLLLDAAKRITDPRVKILIWGAGDELEMLQKRLSDENITNVVFKGRVDKKYIPYIISRSNLNFLDVFDDRIAKYGISSNKLFEYFAAGKPILISRMKNCPMGDAACNIYYEPTGQGIAAAITKVLDMDPQQYEAAFAAAREATRIYNFESLTQKMMEVIEGIH